MRRLALLPVLALLLVSTAQAVTAQPDAGPEVQLSVDRQRPAADDVVRITFTFTGPGAGGSLRAPGSLPLKNLRVIAGPNTATQISFINGDLKRSSSLTYFVKPLGPGAAEVGETSWRIGDKDVRVAAYALDVGPPRRAGDAANASGPGPGAGPSLFDDEDDPIARFFGRQQRQNRADYERPAPRGEPLLSITATPDKQTAYVGEEVVVHYELITQSDVQGIEWVEVPKFPGCWAEDVERPERPTGRADTVDGRRVVRFTLLKKAVSGLAPGKVELPPVKVKLLVRSTGGDPFFDPFSGMRPQVVERETKPLVLKILPIPGHPAFKGPVGQFDLTSSADRTTVPAGEAVTLRLKVAGTGNLRTATDAPPLEVPGARVYPPSARGAAARAQGRGAVSTEWDYVIVPSQPGTVTIPALRMQVFDVAARRVVEKSTAPVTVTVKPGTAPAAAVAASATPTAGPSTSAEAAAAGSAETVPAEPAARPAPAPDRKKEPEPARAVDLARQTVSVPLWAVVAAPLFVLAGGGAAFLGLRRRAARRALLASLAPEPGETKERAADRIERAVRAPLGRRLGVAEGAPLSVLLEALERSDLPADLRGELRSVFSDADFLRFAPQLGTYDAEIDSLRDRAASVLPRIARG